MELMELMELVAIRGGNVGETIDGVVFLAYLSHIVRLPLV